MKKLFYKIIIIITLIILPTIINAKVYNYKDAIEKTNSYIFEFPDYNDYIKLEDMPYNYEAGENKINPYFIKGGFISKDEYQISNMYDTSYLSQGIDYWTLTPQSAQRNYTLNYTLQNKLLTDETNFKVTEFVKNETIVAGNGTLSDPWYFLDVISINLYSSNESRGKLSLKKCENINEGTKTIVVNKYGEQKAKFYICEGEDYRYYKSTCSSYLEREGTTNKMYLFGNINDNAICKMDFGYKTYTITLKGCEGCNNPPTNIVYLAHNKDNYFSDEFGENIIDEITVPAKTGYTFKGYYKDNAFIESEKIIDAEGNFISKDINSNITLEPKMNANTYTITFDSNGGSPVTSTTKSVTYDQEYGELPNTTRAGYTFKGWYTAKSGGTKIESNTKVKITANTTLYARWSANKYKVTLDNQSATSAGTLAYWYFYKKSKEIDGKTIYYYTNEDCTTGMIDNKITVPTKIGHTFGGYYTEKNGEGTQYVKADGITTNNIYKTETKNTTLYAYWTPNKYKVTLDNQSATSEGTTAYWYYYKTSKEISGKTVYYYTNENCTTGMTDNKITVPTKTGYTFGGYYTEKNGAGTQYVKASGVTTNNIYSASANDITLYAKWTPNKYKVTLDNQSATSAGTTSYWYYYNTSKNINGKTIYYYTNENCTSGMTDNKITVPTKTGYTFGGYYTEKNGAGAQYVKADGITTNNIYKTETKNVTLYAYWKQNSTLPSFKYTGKFQVVKDNDSAISQVLNNTTFTGTDYEHTGNWKVRFLTTGDLTVYSLGNATSGSDFFIVGSGQNGKKGWHERGSYDADSGCRSTSNRYCYNGGKGGNGGECVTKTKLTIPLESAQRITVGVNQTSSIIKINGTTYTATSGGGASGGYGISGYSDDGGSGSQGCLEFDETGRNRYAGGGGGAGGTFSSDGRTGNGGSGRNGGGNGGFSEYEIAGSSGYDGSTNTGGGGGGGGSSPYGDRSGGAGGSGIVIWRNSR